ncbi:MAG: hypothetical protein ACREIU_06410, partial [Planctomycetota bacterium]
VALGVAYLLTGVAWLVSGGFRAPEPLQPSEPFLTILEFLILLSAPVVVALMAAVHGYAPRDRKAAAVAALAFAGGFAVLTGGVHFVRLIVVHQLPPEEASGLSAVAIYPWPTVALALDLLAWDLFLGLALLLGACAFEGGGLHAVVRLAMRASGALWVAGVLGPLTGEMRLQFPAILGYAFGLPALSAPLALLFRRAASLEPTRHSDGAA